MIIGLGGFARVGKSSIANELGYHQIAFADVLKIQVAGMLGITLATLEARKSEFRPLLVAYGEAHRKLNPNHWVELVEEEVLSVRSSGNVKNIVITDIRYHNECKWINDQGGKVFLIKRDGVGPANEVELESFKRIEKDSKFTVVYNDSPYQAAQKIIEMAKLVSEV